MRCKLTKLAQFFMGCCLVLLAGCDTGTQQSPPKLHNKHFEAFVLHLTEAPTQVQPIPQTVPFNPAVAKLGKQLFMSPVLSANDTIACATCHIINQGGDDNRPVSTGIFGRKGTLNAPTVLNSGFNIAQFWDGRAKTLEEQVLGPITNPHEMGIESLEAAVAKLNRLPQWKQRFMDVFQTPATRENLAFAIAEFERTLITPNSRFDRYLMGDTHALTAQEKAGWALFQHLGCISCHQGINLGGSMFQKAGIFEAIVQKNDPTWFGRFNVTGDPADKYVLKVPSLRNITKTAPYFHDGSVARLEEAVTIMIEKQTGHTATPDKIDKLIAFLKTLDAPVKDLLHD